jgi:origin recognition complex subunit 1
VKCLKRSAEKNKLDHFDFIEINGMKLSEPRQAYVQILKQLSGKTLTWEQAYNALEKRFNSRTKKPMTLLLVDEVCNYISPFISYFWLQFSN